MRSSRQRYWLIGIDGGGTRTRAAICDASGRVAAITAGEGSNPLSRSWPEVERTLGQLIDELLRRAGARQEEVAILYMGLAGADRPDTAELIRQAFAGAWGKRLVVDNDAIAALYSGTWGQPGIVLIAGTGSIAYGVNGRGTRFRVGGWGYLLGDEGSGYDLGRQAAAAVLRAFDGRGEETALSGMLLSRYGLKTPDELIATLYGSANPRKELASLSSLVETAAQAGDAVALQLIRQAAAHLAELVIACQQKMGERLPVVLAGGMLAADTLLRRELEQNPLFSVCRPAVAPVIGALVAALKQTGAVLDEGRIRLLRLSEADRRKEIRASKQQEKRKG